MAGEVSVREGGLTHYASGSSPTARMPSKCGDSVSRWTMTVFQMFSMRSLNPRAITEPHLPGSAHESPN
jgi:hypothetical protein